MKDPNIKNPEDENSASGCFAKKILVVSYSQSGQLDRIVASLLAPLRSQATIIEEKLAPSTPFPFPWPIHQFLDVFPEAFRGIPCPLQPLKSTASDRYDLVIMAYQVWYLAPSIPISSFLQSREAKSLLQGTPILTIVGCRNMWFRAHAIVRKPSANFRCALGRTRRACGQGIQLGERRNHCLLDADWAKGSSAGSVSHARDFRTRHCRVLRVRACGRRCAFFVDVSEYSGAVERAFSLPRRATSFVPGKWSLQDLRRVVAIDPQEGRPR